MMEFNTIPEVIDQIKRGKMVIIIDDASRENEGDLVMAASFVEASHINFMARHGRGLICLPIIGERLDELKLLPMVQDNQDRLDTAFAISVDAKHGVATGISAQDRARTIRTIVDPKTKPEDLVSPGHIFPLRAKEGGVLTRAGHTEACIDLAKLAGLYPAGVICEIMNDDGTMARTPQLLDFAARHKLAISTIADLIRYRHLREKLVRKVVTTSIPTELGRWRLIVYESLVDGSHHLALVKGKIGEGATLIRVHSECLTGDVFKSKRCDCGEQLHLAMKQIHREGRGVVLYMRQEGRGIGLVNKLKAYVLQDKGLDTVEANRKLGLPPDLRNYGIGAQILVDLGLKKIKLLTNNPRKIVGLEGYGLEVTERVPIEVRPTPLNRAYLKAKREKLGHIITTKEARWSRHSKAN